MKGLLYSLLITSVTLIGGLYAQPAYAAVTLSEYGQLHADGNPDNEVDFTITFNEETVLYSSPEESGITPYSLAPQTVQAVFNEGSYYKIKTSWLGEMWIRPEWPFIFNLNEESKEVVLQTETPVYDYPYTHVLGKLEPQTMKTTASAAGGWLRVETPFGKETWLHPKISAPLEAVPYTSPLEVDGYWLPAYMYPNNRSKMLGDVHERYLNPFEKTAEGDWYHVHSELGDVWVQLQPERIAVDYNQEVELPFNREIHDRPGGSWKGVLGPQTVKASKRLEIWIKVDTWLGEAWIIDPMHEIRFRQGPNASQS
ncbi:hypothetical protein [Paenibacillus puerhi]|uniref:hypothetical protein n=1 Tax=Paenibacillus puerhi TaxID=2692622 RepID=UPI0013596F31|nr:hypothetical protein [Paenibacillus puerhi]